MTQTRFPFGGGTKHEVEVDSRPLLPPDDTGYRVVEGVGKAEAEDLLDWLENHGAIPADVSHTEAGFTITFGLPSTP